MPATILCVQSDRNVRDLYVAALEAEGYQTLPAQDGGQALEILKRQNPEFVILDISLPRQDGFEILLQLRKLRAEESLPVLMIADGEATAEIEERASSLGAIGVVAGPIDADQLIARVGEFVKVGDEASVNPPVARRARAIPEQGSLKQLSFPELMHGLHLAHLDGVLLVEHGRKKKAIEFRDGWPVCVKSNLVSECLGNYLVRTERCSREAVDESIERMRTGEGLQGEILVAMEVLDEDGVVEALENHALEKLYEVFSWRDGSFQVRSGVRIQRGTSIAIEGHPSNLTVQGVRRQTPLGWIDRFIELNAQAFLVPCAGGPEGGLKSVELAPHEIEWIQGLDGSFELGALADEPEPIRRLVFGLLSIELFRVEMAAGNPEVAREVTKAAIEGQETRRLDSAAEDALRTELAKLANRMQGANHYAVLEVSDSASDDEIREAHERLCEQAHPDRFHGASGSVRQLAAQVFDRIEEAYKGIATAQDRGLYAGTLAKHTRASSVEDEGRRALRAETEFQNGEALMQKRDYESALVCFGRAMENFPSEGEYRAHYGWCLYLCHPDNEVMLAEALEHCREGVKLAKDREKPYLLLGRLYKAMGKAVAAKKMFTRAVQIKPRCVEAMRELRIMNMRRDKDKGMLKRLFRR
jgi:CheY-like chemotaxis protein/tetratricopeptide (TPR) repeat protein